MALIQRNGFWYWRKMVGGVQLNRPTKTDDRKLAEKIAKKWEHEAIQAIVFDGERPISQELARLSPQADREEA